jgi:hypothetical protein
MNDDQLSWHERSVLEALEESLAWDDPAFVTRFGVEAQALDGRPRRWSTLHRWLHRRDRESDL